MGRNLHENGQTTLQTWPSVERESSDGFSRFFSCRSIRFGRTRSISFARLVLIIRIPCIFNVLKANQLFPFSILLSLIHFHFISSSENFSYARRMKTHFRFEWCFSIGFHASCECLGQDRSRMSVRPFRSATTSKRKSK